MILLLTVAIASVVGGRGGPDVATTTQGRAAPQVEVLNAGERPEANEDVVLQAEDQPARAAQAEEDDPDANGAAADVAPVAGGAFAGVAEEDLPTQDPNVVIVRDSSGGPDGAIPPQAPNRPDGTRPVTGWDIEDVRFRYDPETDTLTVAINSYGVVGDPEGNGDPSSFDQAWTDVGLGGSDVADLGSQEAVVLMMDLDQDGSLDLFAGTNYGEAGGTVGADLNNLSVAAPNPLFAAFAATIAVNQSAWGDELASIETHSIPSADGPDLVFDIPGFSLVSAAALMAPDENLDFGVNVVMGSGVDGNIGEDTLAGSATDFITVDISAEIGDRVFSDDNGNGVQDSREAGVSGVAVNLLDEAGSAVATTLTDDTGLYRFTVVPGTYSVEFIVPVGSTLTVANAGDDDAADSDPTPASGRTRAITVGAGESNLTVDAGIIPFVPNPDILIEKATNGEDSDVAPGEELVVGEDVEFTYVVTNTGNMRLEDVQVSDDVLGDVSCPTDVLPVGGGFTCTVSTVVTEGEYVNTGSVSGQPIGPDGQPLGEAVVDSDPSHHVGVVPPQPSITLEKATNGEDADAAPGPLLEVGGTATFTYVATNTGNVDLTEVRIQDDVLGFVCRIDVLVPGESNYCEASATVTEGAYVNLGSVSAIPTGADGEPVGDPVSAEDPSHHEGIVTGPPCETSIRGPRMWAGATTIDETGWFAAGGSTIRIVTDEPGGSPSQPNEQVYILVGEDRYGPTPAGLGEAEFDIVNGGVVTIVHWSEVSGETTVPNSVEYAWCGTDLSRPTVHGCSAPLAGPRMWKGGPVHWDTGLVAAPGSMIQLTTSEPGASPGQPNERVYLIVGGEVLGSTPSEHGTHTFTVGAGGPVIVQHWSEFHESDMPNSVEISLCGTELFEG